MKLDNKKGIHFVGIGGIGMSGIASVLLEMGYKVSGSDLESNDLTKRIEAMGGKVYEGHSPSNISEDIGLVVYSSSIAKNNPEVIEAGNKGAAIIHRAQMLAELFNRKKGIAVTGTHGKTTTTSLISVMLKNSKLDPTVIIGGEVAQFNGNASLGKGPYIVAEADESDSSFLCLKPFFTVITNVEMEHLDHFKSLDHIMSSYRSFLDNLKDRGTVFYNHDDANTRKIVEGLKLKASSFGFSMNADIHPLDIKMNGRKTVFKVVYKNKILGKAELNIPGGHNVTNALAAILVGLNMKLKFSTIVRSIKDFTGAKRRFQIRSDAGGVMLIDDYAHHPTEIRAVLSACRNWNASRRIVIFQPHRYTRTKFLADDFGRCFAGADKVILTDIYAASEPPIEGVSIRNIYDRVKASGIDDVVVIEKDKIADYVDRIKASGDMILVLGAGDIKKVADELFSRLDKKSSITEELLDEFKRSVKGEIRLREELRQRTSLRVGGPADIWVEPSDDKDLKRVLAFARANKVPLSVMGNGTNLLASDSGFRGILVHLGSPYFKQLEVNGASICVGAGHSLPRLVGLACDSGLRGLESLVGIPGTVGGAIYMNAGGSTNPMYKNIGDLVTSLKVMDYKGRVKRLDRKGIVFGYRCSNLDPYIVLEAVLKFKKGSKRDLVLSLSKFMKIKRDKQALDVPSAGCVFKNPPDSQFTCGQMIDMLGLKGKRVGGAEISEKHANFIINRKGATAKDVLSLIEFIRKNVRESYGILLELEIKLI